MKRYFAIMLTACLALFSSYALAQDTEKEKGKDEDKTAAAFRLVKSEKLKIDTKNNRIVADGNVRATLSNGEILCDHVEIIMDGKNNKPLKVVATGNIYMKIKSAKDKGRAQVYYAKSEKATYDVNKKLLILEKAAPDAKARPRLLIDEENTDPKELPNNYQLIFADKITFDSSKGEGNEIEADVPNVVAPARNAATTEELMKITEEEALKRFSN